MKYLTTYPLIAATLVFGNATSQAIAEEESILPLSEAIRTAVEYNLDVQLSQLDPRAANARLQAQMAPFDPELFASARRAHRSSGEFDTSDAAAGMRWRLDTGTTVTAQSQLDKTKSGTGLFRAQDRDADLQVSVRQALLRGFGRDANRAGIEQARAGLEIAAESLRETVLGILELAETRYWQVARWQSQVRLVQSNLEVAETLLREAVDRERVGLTTQLEVLQAEASVAQRVEELIQAERGLADAVDLLFESMGVLSLQPEPDLATRDWVAPLELTDYELPAFSSLWDRTAARDPLLAAQAASIRQSEWGVRQAGNNTRPSLDLVLSGGVYGTDTRQFSEAIGNAADPQDHTWSVGVEFSMPWGRRSDKANLTLAETQLEREELRYEALRQQLYGELRIRYRALLALQKSLAAAELTVRLQQAAFEQETGKYEEGLSTFRFVLEAQNALDQARIRLLNTQYQHLEARIALQRLSGELLERHGISEAVFQPAN